MHLIIFKPKMCFFKIFFVKKIYRYFMNRWPAWHGWGQYGVRCRRWNGNILGNGSATAAGLATAALALDRRGLYGGGRVGRILRSVGGGNPARERRISLSSSGFYRRPEKLTKIRILKIRQIAYLSWRFYSWELMTILRVKINIYRRSREFIPGGSGY